MTQRPALLWLLAALCAGSVFAQPGEVTVWRCGADGRSFSDSPCAGGSAQRLAIDRPDAERQQQAQAVAEREAQTARQLRRERLQRERGPREGPPVLAALTVPAAKPVATLRRDSWRHRDGRAARDPAAKPRREAPGWRPDAPRPEDARTSAAGPRAARQRPD